MSYEENYRKPYRSKCACGKGILRYYKITEKNDWNQEREHNTDVEIFCDECKKNYHYEIIDGVNLLVPNGLNIPEEIPPLKYEQEYSSDEVFVGEHDKAVVEKMIADMTAPKHRYIKDLTYEPARKWAMSQKKKSLSLMVEYLCRIFSQYDELITSRKKKEPIINAYNKQYEERKQQLLKIKNNSFKPIFEEDDEQAKRDQKEKEEYEEVHKYDPFDARVSYHDSCKVDSTGCYWDSLHILECVEPQYLILDKPQSGFAKITVVKKYKCKCIICEKEIIADSSEFEILYDDDIGYYPKLQCDCHKVSSFEAKTMNILNERCISYAREFSFNGLVGDKGYPLRFDFAIFENDLKDENDKKKIRFLLELQGPHHYKQGEYNEFGDFIEDKDNVSLGAKEKIEKQKRYDDLKKTYCMEHGIILEHIKYTGSSYEKLEKLITDILKKNGFDDCEDEIPF